MKKVLMLIAAVILAVSSVSAQKGLKAVGIDLGIAPCIEKGADLTNVGLGAKFQYGITDPIRLEADLEYWFKDKTISIFDLSVNAQYVINVVNQFNLYPTVGIGYANISSSLGGSTGKFLANIGIGGEYAIGTNLSLFLEYKYQYIQDFSRMPIQIGVKYAF